MAGVIDMVYGRLCATSSYARREYLFVPGDPAKLTIRLWHSARRNAREEQTTYAVEEEHGHGRAGRVFLLAKQDESAEVYEAFVSLAGPEHDSCTCKAGQVRKHKCKHEDACRDLVENGDV